MRIILTFLALTLSHVCLAAQTSSGLYFNAFGDPKSTSILFVHGGPGYNSWSFEYGAAQQLADAGFYVVVFDQRGCGRSASGIASDYTFAKASQDILEVIQSSHAGHPILIGHSWGGTPSIEFLKLRPGIAKAAILLDAPVSWPGLFRSMLLNSETALSLRGDNQDVQTAKSLMNNMFPSGFLGPFHFSLDDIGNTFGLALIKAGIYFPSVYTAQAKSVYQQLMARSDSHWMQDDQDAPVEGFFANENFYNHDFSKDLHDNGATIYGIYGNDDGLFDPVQLNYISAQLPSGHIMSLAGAGHYTFIDQRDAFIEAVKKISAKIHEK